MLLSYILSDNVQIHQSPGLAGTVFLSCWHSSVVISQTAEFKEMAGPLELL